MSENKTNTTEQIGNSIIAKFINEELMTKFELGRHLDRIMGKHTADINSKIADLKQDVDTKFHKVDVRYNWIIGTTLSVGVAIAGLMIALFILPHTFIN